MNKQFLALIFSVFLITSCNSGDIKQKLGLNKHAPDEFMVLSRPSLSVPPEFNLPSPEDKKLSASKISTQAREVIFKSKINKNKAISSSEKSLLLRAGAHESEPNIRQQLEDDYAEFKEDESSFKKLIAPLIKQKNPEILDADAEKKRLDELNKK